MKAHSVCLTKTDLWLSVGGNTPFGHLGDSTISEIYLRENNAAFAIILVFENGNQLVIREQNVMVFYKPEEDGGDADE